MLRVACLALVAALATADVETEDGVLIGTDANIQVRTNLDSSCTLASPCRLPAQQYNILCALERKKKVLSVVFLLGRMRAILVCFRDGGGRGFFHGC